MRYARSFTDTQIPQLEDYVLSWGSSSDLVTPILKDCHDLKCQVKLEQRSCGSPGFSSMQVVSDRQGRMNNMSRVRPMTIERLLRSFCSHLPRTSVTRSLELQPPCPLSPVRKL